MCAAFNKVDILNTSFRLNPSLDCFLTCYTYDLVSSTEVWTREFSPGASFNSIIGLAYRESANRVGIVFLSDAAAYPYQ